MSASRHHNALEQGYRLHWYRIESVLGQGGFGITYLATDTNLDQPVAIKEFLPSDLAVRTRDSGVHPVSEERRETFGWGLNRFLAEARTLAQFRHPNIVRVYSVFEANGTAYMVMEYEQGTSLEDALKFRRLAGERALLGLMHALMDGLDLVHAAGFIHRDIKPDNIYMRANDGVPVLLDFGSARQAVGVETRTLTSLVTPGYAPFEQYNATREHDRQGPWTDIYSLAATLYRGVTGRGPIDAVARADALLRGEPDPLLTLAQREPAGISPQLVAAVDHGLAFQPADRPQSLAEWRTELPPRPTAPDFSAAAITAPMHAVSDADAPTVVREEGVPVHDAATRVRGEDAPAAQAPVPQASEDMAPAGRGRRHALLFMGLLALVLVAGLLVWFVPEQPPSPAVQAPHGAQASRETRPQTPATDRPGDALRSDSAQIPRAPAPPAVTAPEPPAATVRETIAALAAERERLADERRALLTERERRALESEQRAAEQVRRVDEARARLADERRDLEALREREVVRTMPGSAAPAPAPSQPADAAAASPAAPVAAPVTAPAQADASDAPARERTRALLAAAQQDLDALRLSSPAGSNAVERYRAVLAVEPDNQAAADGLERVVQRYLDLVEDALRAGDFARADTMLDRAKGVGPSAAAVSAAAARLAQARRQAEEQAAEQAAREVAQLEAAQRDAAREAAQQAARRAAEEAAQRARLEDEQRRAVEQQRAAAAQAARQREAEADAARQVSIGIFPNASSSSCYFPVGARIEEAARAEAAAHARVSLGYSYYAPGADTSTLGQGYDVWQGSAVQQQPNVPKVRAAAGSLGVDAVLMGWYQCNDSQYADENTYILELFLVDLRTGAVQRTKSPTLDTARAVRELLAAMYTARGL